MSFLQRVTDAFRATGPRLAQSYQDASGLTDVGFIYDNALTAIALLAAGDVRRARAIGDGFLAVQEADGRLRQAYLVGQDPPVPAANFGFTGTAVGDMSWTGLALAQLARATRDRRYLDGLVLIGTWIQDNAYSTTGLGGYEFGLTPGLEGFKSAEHNIDVYALFRLLARLTGDQVWSQRAEHAWDFVERCGTPTPASSSPARTTAPPSTRARRSCRWTSRPGPGWPPGSRPTPRRWTGRPPTWPPPTPRCGRTPP